MYFEWNFCDVFVSQLLNSAFPSIKSRKAWHVKDVRQYYTLFLICLLILPHCGEMT